MDVNAIANVLVVAVTIAAGLTIAAASTARLAGALLTASGLVGAVGLWLLTAAPSAAETVLLISSLVLFPGSLWAYPIPAWRHPLDPVLAAGLIGPGVVAVLWPATALTMGITAFLAFVVQTWWRLERADPPSRRALSWLALTGSVVTLVSLGPGFVSPEGTPALSIGVLAAVPVAMSIGVLRPDTVDVRGLSVSAAVATTMSVAYLSYFVGALAVLELLAVNDPGPVALAAIGLGGAVMLRPAASAMRSVMDQLLFGGRPDPLAAANRVVSEITGNPQDALESVRETLALPYLELRRGQDVVVRAGEPVQHLRELPSGDMSLVVGLRPGDLTLNRADADVLRLVTPLLGQIVRATELSDAVQQLRSDELIAVAEERRRLRAELHDDLGPTLTGIAFTTDAAGNLLHSDPQTAAELLANVRRDTAAAISQIRQIVYGMRPAALVEMGLVEALEQNAPTGIPCRVVVQGELPALSEAVEVAAYRVIIEALRNATRHSDATATTVSLKAGDALRIEVTDNGRDCRPWQPGVGMTSMRDRVTALGGTFHGGPGPDGGVVWAELPFR